MILWLGWFGFNPGSTLGTSGSRFAEIVFVTNLAAAAGAIGAAVSVSLTTKRLDVGMVGNGVIAALVAITAGSGFVEFWAAPIIGGVAGIRAVGPADDRVLDDPVGALSAHGVAGVWGTLACGLFSSPRLIDAAGLPGRPGLVYSGSFDQLGIQAVGVLTAFVVVFSLSYLTFAAVKAVFGLRVTDQEEQDGLDIVEHGMYGYPEQFIDGQLTVEGPLGPVPRPSPAS